MTATALKKELHKAIEIIDDESFLKAVYTIIHEKTNEYRYELSAEQWAEVDRRVRLHKAGKSKTYSWEEVKKNIKPKLKNK